MTYVKWMDKRSKLVKIILALPVINIFWGIYRICKSWNDKNTLGVVLGIIFLFFGIVFWWIVDIVSIVLRDKILWF